MLAKIYKIFPIHSDPLVESPVIGRKIKRVYPFVFRNKIFLTTKKTDLNKKYI